MFVFKISTKGAFRVFNAIIKLVCQESCYKRLLKSRRTFVELNYTYEDHTIKTNNNSSYAVLLSGNIVLH